MTEQQIQTKIANMLKSRGYLVVKNMSVSLNGYPDLTAIRPDGKHIHFEVKTETGRLSPVQIAMHRKIQEHNTKVYTVRSWEEVKEIIDEKY